MNKQNFWKQICFKCWLFIV